MRKFIALFLALGIVSACVASQPLAPQKRANIKTIAVLSGLGDQFSLIYLAVTIFTNKTEEVTVDWRFDDAVRAMAAAKLKDHYQVVDVPYEPKDLAVPTTYEERVFGSNSAIVERLRRIIPAGQVDVVIVVAPDSIRVGTDTVLEGVGLYNRVLDYRGVSAFAVYRVLVFDGNTFETLASSKGSLPPTGIYRITTPFVRMPWRWSGAPFESLTVAQREDIHRALLDVFNRSLDRALVDASLLAGHGS